MPTFPDSVDIVPEYVGGIVNFLNAQANGDDAEPFEAGDVTKLAATAPTCSTTPASPFSTSRAATDTNAFFVTQDYSESEGVTKLSDLEGKTMTWPRPPTARVASTARAG